MDNDFDLRGFKNPSIADMYRGYGIYVARIDWRTSIQPWFDGRRPYSRDSGGYLRNWSMVIR